MKKIGIVFCLWGLVLSAYSQYVVTGGNYAPLLALDNTPNRLAIYLVYGTTGVRIEYTGSSPAASHQWYKYTHKALEGEKIPSTQSGAVSFVDEVQEGCGYFVQEDGVAARRYVWIIDYSKYAFDINSLSVAQSDNVCEGVYLAGEMQLPQLSYYTPAGIPSQLQRSFRIRYETLNWQEQNKQFADVDTVLHVNGDPRRVLLDAPLCDTQFTLEGDTYAEYFQIGKTMTTDLYQAVAVQAHTEILRLTQDGSNVEDKDQNELGGSAPVEISFAAYANDPVAAAYTWKIYRKEDGPQLPLVQYSEEALTYTFETAGSFLAELQVSDRTGTCVFNSDPQEINIAVSSLKVPNAFSPGTTPGINDEFKVVYKSIVKFKGWIFNRWGVQMFEWSDPAKGWDGKKGGKFVSPGVYFYIIEAEGSEGKKYKLKGDINILRSKEIDISDENK